MILRSDLGDKVCVGTDTALTSPANRGRRTFMSAPTDEALKANEANEQRFILTTEEEEQWKLHTPEEVNAFLRRIADDNLTMDDLTPTEMVWFRAIVVQLNRVI